jgi:hypothetical protein
MTPRSIAFVLSAFLLATPATSVAQSSSPDRKFRVLVNVNYNLTSRTFAESSTFTSFLEEGSTARTYDGGTGLGFELGGIYSITSAFGILGSFEFQSAEHDASFDVAAPHPLFFNQPRTTSDDIAALEYSERALNVDAVYTLTSGAFTVDVFGGATFFFTETELIDEITTSSVYPFDDLDITSTTTVKLKENPIGFNVGGAFTYRITPVVGVSFQAKYSKATVNLLREAGEPIDIDAGGFRIGGGIRLAF